MDGDLAPVRGLLELAERYDALLILDEAHATGVLGAQGRGVTDLLPPEFSFNRDRLIKVGTLSKALGSQGGFICGPRVLCRWLVNAARPYIFSTALAPPAAAAAREAIRLVQTEPERRTHVLELAALLRVRLEKLGIAAGGEDTPIVPIMVGDAKEVVALSRHLQDEGLLVPAIRPPSVPPDTARLRISLTAGHSREDVLRLVDALARALRKTVS